MNLRQFSIALLISAIPLAMLADPRVSWNSGDFVVHQKISDSGEEEAILELSKSGKAKLRKLEQSSIFEGE